MAIVLPVLKWRHYLLGRTFIIRTVEQSLKLLIDQSKVGSEYHCWVRKLLGFNFQIQYMPGASNRAADALSRRAPLRPPWVIWSPVSNYADLQAHWSTNLFISHLIAELQEGKQIKGYEIQHGQLFYKGRKVLL